jgi:membrane protease YdiL (CAAX protease family)
MILRDIFINRYTEVRVGWRLLLFLTLLVVILLALSAPLKMSGVRSDLVARIITLAAAIGASFVMTRFVNKKPFDAIGLSLHQNTFREFGIGCLLGFLMISGVFVVELMAGYIHVQWRGYSVLECTGVLGLSLVLFAVAAFAEELLFRGYAFQTLLQWITFLPAMLVFSLLFAYAHYFNPNVTALSLVNVGLAGMWLSVAYMKTRSLWLPFGLHVSWNFAQTSFYSFPTSGGSFEGQKLSDLIQTGPEWVTGGAFGPEGGVLATVALVVCTWYILKSIHVHAPEGIVTLDSVEDLLTKPGVEGEQAA